MWAVVVEGSHDGALDHPDLPDYASGQALELASAMLTGVEATGEPLLSPEVVDIDSEPSPREVWVEDCGEDSGWLVTGHEGTARTESRLIKATVRYAPEPGRWKVDELWMGDYGSC